jgi:hypothetical protein
MNHSAPKPLSPTRYVIAVAFTDAFRQMYTFSRRPSVDRTRRVVPIVMDCVTEPGLMFEMSPIFPKNQTQRRTGLQD